MVITYEQLLRRLIDMEGLALLPQEGESCVQSSSYDRESVYDHETDTYRNWGANQDWGGSEIIQEDGGKVLAQMEGPGCLWRIWFGNPIAGCVKIFLDDAEIPVFSGTIRDLCALKHEPFVYPELCYVSAMGHNCYVPISYNRSCKVVAYGDFGAWYQFNHTKFPEGTTVETMPIPLLATHKRILQQVNDRFADVCSGADVTCLPQKDAVGISPHSSTVIYQTKGSGAISGLRIKPELPKDPVLSWRALKELTISIYFDGEVRPSVWSPLGDFFGASCGITPFATFPSVLSEDGSFFCRWFMPYKDGVKIVIGNDGDCLRILSVAVERTSLSQPVEHYMRFHAKWNRNRFSPTRSDRWPDYTVLTTTGRGRFVGMTLHVFKPADNRDMKSLPGEYWWGEGDEKFFIDGEKFPSHFGTGTEDYFGYAWAWPDLFCKAYHTQSFNQGGIHNRGNRSFSRFHVSDGIPFQTSFEACLEKYYDENFVRYGAVAYWYLAEDGTDKYEAVSLEERMGYYVEDADVLYLLKKTGSVIVNHDFSTGDTSGWGIKGGSAFENAVVTEEGGYHWFSYETESGDEQHCELISTPFLLTGDTIDFLLAGTWRRDPENSFVALVRLSDGEVLASACCDGDQPRRVIWDVRDYRDMTCVFKIIDEGRGGKRRLRLTDLHIEGDECL